MSEKREGMADLRFSAPNLLENVQPLSLAGTLSTTTRIMSDVPYPIQSTMEITDLFGPDKLPKMEQLKTQLYGEGRISCGCLEQLTDRVTDIFNDEENMLDLEGVITVVGEICGHFYDLLKILENINFKKQEKVLFLGSYWGDGKFGAEVMIYLMALKLVYPRKVFMLRGNRECRVVAREMFLKECIVKYSQDVWESMLDVCMYLPIAARINETILCVHSGISPCLLSLDDYNTVNRFKEPTASGILTDTLWADPNPDFGEEAPDTPYFSQNEERNISVYFTSAALVNFLTINKLGCLIRSNQPSKEGFTRYMAGQKNKESSMIMLNLFSAPNFRENRNIGAVLTLTPNMYFLKRFLWSEQPYWLGNFIDAFTWSLPFAVEKLTLFMDDFIEMMDRTSWMDELTEAKERSKMREDAMTKSTDVLNTGFEANIGTTSRHLSKKKQRKVVFRDAGSDKNTEERTECAGKSDDSGQTDRVEQTSAATIKDDTTMTYKGKDIGGKNTSKPAGSTHAHLDNMETQPISHAVDKPKPKSSKKCWCI